MRGRKALQVLRETSSPEYVSDLVDITDLPMDALEDLPDTVLASVLRDVRCPSGESFAAFSSALL
ncbi:FxSxx-COOH cyclophane-containing RiPP peptide [Streptomyces canus]|uniref:FxSxx-COOH cyclophane-containing RiPP peptide n=1 Tax=Streptomyces TaxID=1883 RepID=UPI001CED6360|nr:MULTISPECIES: FxSxx-COOH cyclophane-containing RiPP peptide [Streptomyces]MDI5909969.1 FxSxx-COOH protein [Streptomyces sp. 12257]